MIDEEYLVRHKEDGVAPADPHKYFARDYMGLVPTPDFDKIAQTSHDTANAMKQRIISLMPLREEVPGRFSGLAISRHKNDPNFYDMRKHLKEVGKFTFNTQIIPLSDDTTKFFKLSAEFYTNYTKKGKAIRTPSSTHTILINHYLSIYNSSVSAEGKATYTAVMQNYRMSARQRNAYNRARMAKMEQGKMPRVTRYPAWYIFTTSGFYENEANFFAQAHAYGVQCGIIKPGEFFDKAPIGITKMTSAAEFVQVAAREVKKPFPHIEAIFWWDDPILVGVRKGYRAFLLFGASIAPVGKYYGPEDKKITRLRHNFLALEFPTSGVLCLPIFGPGLPLYHRILYRYWLAGKLEGLRIGGQFLTIIQPHPEFCPLPPRIPSLMPRCELYFDKAKARSIKWEGNL